MKNKFYQKLLDQNPDLADIPHTEHPFLDDITFLRGEDQVTLKHFSTDCNLYYGDTVRVTVPHSDAAEAIRQAFAELKVSRVHKT